MLLLRKSATSGAGAAAAAAFGASPPPILSPPSTRAEQGRFSGARIRLFLLLLFIGAIALILANSPRSKAPVSSTAELPGGKADEHLRTSPPPPPPANLNDCDLVKKLLAGEIPSSNEGLPKAGKQNEFGLVFWLKTPVLHAMVDGRRMLLLKYNKYLPKQHDLKYGNTVAVLSRFGSHESKIFPQMFAHCDDAGDGFHYILVEYLSLHPSQLPKPENLAQCAARAKRVVQLFVTLDEDMHLAFMDVKKGQWMARSSDGSFVLNDVDDMVHSPWRPSEEAGDLYTDQVDTAKRIVQDLLPQGTTAGEVDKLWEEEMFPHGYTIRYAMILLRYLLIDDLGFRWSECGDTTFRACLQRILDWGATAEEDWPAPKQVLRAIGECEESGSFERTKREAAAWRDLPATTQQQQQQLVNKGKPYISCIRAHDFVKKTNVNYTDNVQWCEDGSGRNATARTCCRAKGKSQPCYYWVKQSLCAPTTTASFHL